MVWEGRRRETSPYPDFRLIPQRVHLGERCILKRAAFRRECLLDVSKTPFELGVGLAQRHFWIGLDVAREIHQCEHEIAGFGGDVGRLAVIEGGFDFVDFLTNFGEDRARIVPVEADAGRLPL